MCDSTFAFGQRGSHFFQCPSQREYTRLPKKLSDLLSSSQLRQIYHVALGFEDSFLITWRDNDGQDRIESTGLPSELVNFLYARNAQRRLVRDISNIRCALGPYNSSFFVHDKSAYLWKSLPAGLLSALQSRIKGGDWVDRPRVVALGANDNFLIVTEKHAAVWALDYYRPVSKLLQDSQMQQNGISWVHSIVLHPYRFHCFVSQARNGTLFFENLPPHTLPGIQAMVSSIIQDTKGKERGSLARTASDNRESMRRRPSALQQRAQLRREWSEHNQEFSAQAKGLKLSLSLNVSLGGLARMLG